MTDSNCYGCIQAIKDKISSDESIVNLAKQIAKKEDRAVGLWRNTEGQLCISTGTDPVHQYITPLM